MFVQIERLGGKGNIKETDAIQYRRKCQIINVLHISKDPMKSKRDYKKLFIMLLMKRACCALGSYPQ